MSFTLFAVGLLSLQAAAATDENRPEATAAGTENGTVATVEEAKPKKITDKSHPDYVRCKSESVIGSRARRKKTCMTNREWALVSRRGNEATRDFVGDNAAGFQSGSN